MTKLPESGVRISLDFGQVRIGVARCDSHQLLAVPVTTLQNSEDVFAQIEQLLIDFDPSAIYLGLPVNLLGADTMATQSVRKFGADLKVHLAQQSVSIPIQLVDERLSTASAQALARNGGKTIKESRGFIDQAAAVEILELALAIERRTGSLAGTQVH
ncbi:MAG: Holliday junction resolvase RuvX [Actinobacteria bacterium]|nr:Holliday junction resolvase RuvX [Actinomycetota bacterium]NBY15850.1 Holliday junction resolvase RuvX [Actinomycetota bacterium]